jgi:D-tyrosyl-tRNA(Tyr) deacylase
VVVGDETVGQIGGGLVVLLGIAETDGEDESDRLAGKVARLRIFAGDDGRFDHSVLDAARGVLAISQFTLIADTRRGNRPSFSDAARPEHAEPLYRRFCDTLHGLGVPVERGSFGAHMQLELVNDGPVTIVLDT